MKPAEVVDAPDPRGADQALNKDAEALIKEARRRQRRRYAVTSLAMAAILIGALGAFAAVGGASQPPSAQPPPAGHPRPKPVPGHAAGQREPGPIPASVHSTVLMWPVGPEQDGTIYLDNLSTGSLGWATPVVDPGEYQPILGVGGQIVYVMKNEVMATDAATGKTRALGKALAFAPSARPGQVWLEYGFYRPNATTVTVRSASVASSRPGQPVTLPRGTQLIAGTDAGLLLQPHFGGVNGPLWLWNPGSSARTAAQIAARALPYSAHAYGFDVSPRLVAYGTGCRGRSTAQNLSYEGNFGYDACRWLRVFDVVTGRLRSFPAPPGTSGWVPSHGGSWAWSVSAIAPSGTLMAAEAVIPPDSKGIARMLVLHLAGTDTRATAVPSSAAFLLSVTAWSAHGSWLFYQGPGEHLWAYQVSTGKVRSSSTSCCQYAVMATLNSPPS